MTSYRIPRKPNVHAGLRLFLFGADLKLEVDFLGSFPRLTLLGISSEFWQDTICATHGVCAVDQLCSHRCHLFRRRTCHDTAMHRTLSGHGLGTAQVAGITARYRSHALGANLSKLYGMGFGQTVRRSTLADASERGDWRIWYDLAMRLLGRADKLHACKMSASWMSILPATSTPWTAPRLSCVRSESARLGTLSHHQGRR